MTSDAGERATPCSPHSGRSRHRRARHLFATLIFGVLAVGLLPLDAAGAGAATTPVAWLPCTNATLASGTCVPGYGSAPYNGKNGYLGLPATLSGPGQLYISPVFCPAGSQAAKAGQSCSAPFALSLEKVSLSHSTGVIRVEKLGYESSGGLNGGGAHAVLDNPLATASANPAAQWCVTVATNANPSGQTCPAGSATSLPVYLVASAPPALGTVLMCVGGESSPTKGAFEACIQTLVSTTPFTATQARSATKSSTKRKKPASLVSVALFAPTITSHVLAVGATATVTVGVSAAVGSLTQVTLSTGLTPGTSTVVTTTQPVFSNVTTANGVTSGFTFTFTVKAQQAGQVIVDVAAATQLSTGSSATGAAQLPVSVG